VRRNEANREIPPPPQIPQKITIHKHYYNQQQKSGEKPETTDQPSTSGITVDSVEMKNVDSKRKSSSDSSKYDASGSSTDYDDCRDGTITMVYRPPHSSTYPEMSNFLSKK
jgi:hypothetical protein